MIFKILSIVLIPSLIGIIIYLLGSFVMLDFDITQWDPIVRFFVSIIELVFLGIGINVAHEESIKYK